MLIIGAHVVGALGGKPDSRLPHGCEFFLHNPDVGLLLLSDSRTGTQPGMKEATLTLDSASLFRLVATLRVKADQYMTPDEVIWNVKRTEAADDDGNVAETIGWGICPCERGGIFLLAVDGDVETLAREVEV